MTVTRRTTLLSGLPAGLFIAAADASATATALTPAETGLLDAAFDARKHAYAPYSKFFVGAALLTENGTVIPGCNVENASFGATNCAERTAIFAAVAQGHTKFRALAVVGDLDAPITPCGICRQVLAEFGHETVVVCSNLKRDTMVTTAGALLPGAFDFAKGRSKT
ncbi:MAG TPA: cytidine deaminase [Rhizomicrobium sp.]|nr:cytidine deaminase [Rhizomicrobium sp.]